MKKSIKLCLIVIALLLIFTIVFASCNFELPKSPDSDTGNNDAGNGDGGDSGSGDSGSGGSGDSGSGDSGNSGSGGSGDNTGDNTNTLTDLEIYDLLFAPESRVEIKLDITNSELAKLQADYETYSSKGSKSPIYRMANITIKLTDSKNNVYQWTIDQVGVRMKGNTSRCNFYSQSDGMYNLIHFKISFGETFDKSKYYGDEALVWESDDERSARKDRTFATLEKMDMKWNRNDDETYIKEIYSYDLFRENGVIAPHTNLASVDIGADHAGVWTIYEPIDDILLAKYLPKEAQGGDLYKLGWTTEGATFTSFSSYGAEDEDKGLFYVYDIKTNKKTTTHQSLQTLISTLNGGTLTREIFESVVDMDNFIPYSAVSYIIGNPDDLRNNYNNCYIYFRADTGKLMIIPYDMDRVFGINTWNPYGDSMTTDSPFATNNVAGEQRSPLFKTTLCKNGLFADEYFDMVKQIMASDMLSNSAFANRFNLAKSLYNGLQTPSKVYQNANGYSFSFDINATCSANGNTNMSFADYMSAKRKTVDNYSNSSTGNANLPTRPSTPDAKPEASFDLCIRGDFTNWNRSDEYKLSKVADGKFGITITRDSEFKFKIHDANDNKWYGAEWVDYDCPAYLTYDNDKNIVLPAGSYYIEFDIATRIIYISAA